MIHISNIKYGYKSNKEVLNDISFTLEKGEFMAILGNNGVGKSTLLKCLNKILKAESGEFLMDSENITTLSTAEVAKRIAFVSQNVANTQMTVHDVVMLGRKPYMKWCFTEKDHEIVHEVMHKLNIEELRGRYLNQLSGGERQKVMLARALAQHPKLLLLDEPTSSLDIYNQYQVLQLVKDICKNEGLTAIVVIHDLNLALRFCDKFLMLKDGRVYACGDYSIMNEKTLTEVYKVQAKIADVEGHKMIVVN